jgi:uncharacterized membrane protein YphA (DoxX/SURF4 family)
VKPNSLDYLLLLCRIILGVVFIYASFDKIINPAGYAEAVANYKLVPYYLINIFAIVIPWLEFIGGIFLLTGVFLPGSSLIIGGLLIIFILAIASALVRNLDISCGCFNTAEGEKIGNSLILRDLILLILTGYVFFFSGGKITLDYLRKKVTSK